MEVILVSVQLTCFPRQLTSSWNFAVRLIVGCTAFVSMMTT